MLDSEKVMSRGDAIAHRKYKKGEYIYLPEDEADRIFFIMEGRVKVGNFGESSKEVTKTILNKGEVFGELSLVGEDQRRDFAIAMEDTSICAMTVEDMRFSMRKNSAVSMFMMKLLGQRMMDMENRLESLIFKDSRTRIIEFIEQLGQRQGQQVGFEVVVRKFMTHQEIANMTATSRQTVTTVLNELRNKNIITFDRRRLLIRDMEKLREETMIS